MDDLYHALFLKPLYSEFGSDFDLVDDIKEFADLYKSKNFSFYNFDQDKIFIADPNFSSQITNNTFVFKNLSEVHFESIDCIIFAMR